MQPFYQGKVDTFCALYAVLNAMQILFGLRSGPARALFNEVVVAASKDEPSFRDVLTLKTNYKEFVHLALTKARSQYPFCVEKPWPRAGAQPKQSELERLFRTWARPQTPSTVIFRFCRYMPFRGAPIVEHWTCAHFCDESHIQLFDCSKEDGSVHALPMDAIFSFPEDRGMEYFVIEPWSVHLLSPM